MSNPVRIGAIGCGGMLRGFHAPEIAKIAGMELTALCDIDAARLADTAKQLGVSATFTDMETMLDSCALDALCIIGPPSMHVEAAALCLKRQVPFLVEKPLALRVEDARRLSLLAEAHGDCGQVGFTSRYSPAQRLAWRTSRSPEFGKVISVATTHLTHATMHPIWGINHPVEAFINLHGVHAVDLWRFFGGDPVQVTSSLSGYHYDEDKQSGYGSVLVHVRVAGGPHGTIHMKAGSSHNGDINSDIMGERTRIRVENDQDVIYENGQEWTADMMAGDPLENVFPPDQVSGHFLGSGLQMHTYRDFFRYEWMAFKQALDKRESFSPSVRDACSSVYLTAAICQSLREKGSTVEVEY